MRTINSQQSLTRDIVESSLRTDLPESPRGRPTHPFDPLLVGSPDLDPDCGVALVPFEAGRPFHPTRLHDALDVLLDGVVTARGRLWLASDPDDVMWLDSAGGALGIRHVGTWLACADDTAQVAPEHRALAALRWDPEHGDRHTSLTVLCHRADPDTIVRTLTAALVDDDEIAQGPDYLAALPSPFGHAHRDPCDDLDRPDESAADQVTTTPTESRTDRDGE
jgi:G3E family GTPase